MKTNLTPFLFTSLVVLLSKSILVTLVLAKYPDCVTMGRQPGTNGAAWNRGAIVTVVINPDDFPTSTEREAIQRAFTAWQNANTNSGVTFTFTTGSSPAGAMNTFYIRRDTTETGGYTNIANTGSPTSEGNITTIRPQLLLRRRRLHPAPNKVKVAPSIQIVVQVTFAAN